MQYQNQPVPETGCIISDLAKEALATFFNTLYANNMGMGSICIAVKDTVVYQHSVGYKFTTPTGKIPAHQYTRYRVGSISKSFTAVLIFQLYEEGLLDLNAVLSKYIPGVPNGDRIRISDLLHHRSGLHDISDTPDFRAWSVVPRTQQQVIDRIIRCTPDFEPDERAVYSNTNYIFLGFIAERVTGLSLKQLIKERICNRGQLNSTYYGGKIAVQHNECYSYTFQEDWVVEDSTCMDIAHGAGAVVATPYDLTVFIRAVFTGKFFSKATLDYLLSEKDTFGMGIHPIGFCGKPGHGHHGALDGFASQVWYYPEKELSIAYCANGLVYPINRIMIRVLQIIFK